MKGKMPPEVAEQYNLVKDRSKARVEDKQQATSEAPEEAPEVPIGHGPRMGMEEFFDNPDAITGPSTSGGPTAKERQFVKQLYNDQDHPVMLELLEEFGLSSSEAVIVKMGKKYFTLRAMSMDLIQLAKTIVAAGADTENSIRLMMVACSVSHIGIPNKEGEIKHIPLYQVMSVKVPENLEVTDEKYPPSLISRLAAVAFHDFLNEKVTPTLMSKLYRAVKDNFDKMDLVETELEHPNSDLSLYTCDVDGCDVVYLEEQGLRRFCKEHGEAMFETKPEDRNPLGG